MRGFGKMSNMVTAWMLLKCYFHADSNLCDFGFQVHAGKLTVSICVIALSRH